MLIIFSLFVLVNFILAQQESCSQNEGTEIRRGQIWVICRKGVLYPSACVYLDAQTKSERRLELGSSVWTSANLLRCDQISPNSASVVQISCIRNNRVLPIGQPMSGRLFWYLCKKDEKSGLLLQLSGCVDQSGQLVQPNGLLIRGNFVYTCLRNETDQSVYMEPRGCLVGGQLYNLGDQVIAHGFWYVCNARGNASRLISDQNEVMELKLMGCYQDGQKLKNGESFQVGQFGYKCDLNSNSISRTSAGCYARSSNGTYEMHPFGDRWLEGNPPVRIVMECKARGKLGVTKGPVQCYYESNDRLIQGRLDPGCLRLFSNNVMITCSITDGKKVDTQIVIRATRAQVDDAKKQGFEEC